MTQATKAKGDQMTNTQSVEQRLAGLEAKMDGISGQLQELIDAKRPLVDLGEEVGPIARAMMDTGIEQLAHLDDRGYFAFMNEVLYLVDRLVEDYDPDDLHALADSAANILDTVKVLTQPAVLAVARDLAEVVEAGEPESVGLFGALGRIRGERDVQRGLGFALDLLGTLGRGVSRAPRASRDMPGGSRTKQLKAPPAPRRQRSEASPNPRGTPTRERATASPLSFIEDTEWDKEYAQEVANERGVGPLTAAHWTLINFARKDYKTTGSAPNIRRITMQTKVSTREVYQLFPKAPGLAISHIAGVPKPVGCL